MTLLFFAGLILKLPKNGVKITNSSNLLIISKNVTLTVLDCCLPSPICLIDHCVDTALVIEASLINPNFAMISRVIHLVSEIYENC